MSSCTLNSSHFPFLHLHLKTPSLDFNTIGCYHRVIILNRDREREESDANFPDRNVQRHSVMSLETARSLANYPSWGGGGGVDWERSMYSAFPRSCSVSYLSFVYGRSLWAELNGGENSLHWKANMLLLFSIMTLWMLPLSTLKLGIV